MSASARDEAGTTSSRDDRWGGMSSATLSVRQVNVMRVGYFVMGRRTHRDQVAVDVRPRAVASVEGAANDMLVAMGLLALLGLRHPVTMLPILLFEALWKLMSLGVVALPLWVTGRMDADTAYMADGILWIVIVLAASRGDTWSGSTC